MLIKKDVFNSDIFGIVMGNIIIDNQYENIIEELESTLQIASEEGYQHLTIKIPTTQKNILSALCKKGFYLVDILVELVYERKVTKEKNCSNVILREFEYRDIETLKNIARTSFELDRYHSDLNLSNKLCDEYYEKWIENSCNGFAEGVTVAEKNNNICGFFSYKTYSDDEFGHLVLGAVDEKFRGNGIFHGLICKSRDLMLEKHSFLKGIKVGTQLINVAAMRAYSKAGFQLNESYFVLHKYINEEIK